MAELKFDLTPWQRTVYTDDTRFKVIVAGRRCGKTRLSAVMLITKALQCPSIDARVMYVAPTQGMAYDLMWDLVMMLAEPLIAKAHINDGDITLKNGVKIQIRGADKPDRLRGKKLFYAILDEMKDIKDGTWESSIRPSLSDMEGGALFIGTPEPEAVEFRKIFDRGQDGDDPEWKSWLFTTADNPYIKRSEIEAAKKSMGSAEFFREYEASWDTAGSNLLRIEWLKTGKAPLGSYATYIAIDPSGYTGVTTETGKKSNLDYFAIAVVRVYENGHWWVQKIDYGRWDVRESAVRVLMAIRTHKPLAIGIEKGALMRAVLPYLEDLMRKNQVFAHIHSISTGGIAKENRIVYALQGLLEHGRIVFNEDENWDEIKREMIGFPSPRVHDDCFPAGTLIMTLNGEKCISEVTTDDYVLTGSGEFKKVLKAWCKGNKEVITRYGITATPEHRIFTLNRQWVSLDSLSDDDIICVVNAGIISSQKCQSRKFVVENVQTENRQGLQEKNVPVYDLMVEGRHEFFADGVLVHNCLDALAYISHLQETTYQPHSSYDDYEPLDEMTGI